MTVSEFRVFTDIAIERARQIEVEGWTPEHDDSHGSGELAKAAACYAVGKRIKTPVFYRGTMLDTHGFLWPWAPSWWKPRDRRHDLIRAGALIVAEIERLDRAAVAGG